MKSVPEHSGRLKRVASKVLEARIPKVFGTDRVSHACDHLYVPLSQLLMTLNTAGAL